MKRHEKARDGVSAALKFLKPQQVRAIHALETERSITAAAEKAGVGLRTLHRWLREPLFAEVVRCLRVQHYQDARHARLALAGTAVEQLGKMLDDPETPPAVRARLIHTAFEQADRMNEMMRALGQSTTPNLDLDADFTVVQMLRKDVERFKALARELAGKSKAPAGESAATPTDLGANGAEHH